MAGNRPHRWTPLLYMPRVTFSVVPAATILPFAPLAR